MIAHFALALALAAAPPPGTPIPSRAVVQSVYDGDTFTLATGDKIRLKWANTPELKPHEPYSDEARALTERLVLGREVELIVDQAAPRDGYGRILAAIRVDGTDLSMELIRAGCAHLYLIPPVDGDPAPYLAAQEEARAARRGIWTTDRFQGDLHITSFHANAPGDESLDPNLEYVRVANVTSKPFDLAGYRMADAQGNAFPLPSVVIPPGNTVMVLSGKGETQADPSRQLRVHLGSDQPVWSNTYDRAVILSPDGQVVDAVEYKPKTR